MMLFGVNYVHSLGLHGLRSDELRRNLILRQGFHGLWGMIDSLDFLVYSFSFLDFFFEIYFIF